MIGDEERLGTPPRLLFYSGAAAPGDSKATFGGPGAWSSLLVPARPLCLRRLCLVPVCLHSNGPATPWPPLPAWGAGLSAGTGLACSVAQVGSPPARDACYWPMGYCLRRLGYCVLAWSDLEHARPPPPSPLGRG